MWCDMTKFLIKKFIKDFNNTNSLKVRTSYGKLSGIVGIICNLILFVSKFMLGFFTYSISIIADAVNNLSDASSSVVNLVGFKLSGKPADEEHPYGHGRYEYLSALCVSLIILVIGVELLKSGIEKIINPQRVIFGVSTLVILSLSVIIKLWLMFFNKTLSKKINSKALIATSKDCRNDVIATLSILLGAIISHYTHYELDGWLGVGVSIFILYSGFLLVKETIDPMLGSAPSEELIENIKNKILSFDGVLGMHDLIVHDYGPLRKFASVHVEMNAETDVIKSHEIIDNIERDMLKDMGIHLIIHFDPVSNEDSIVCEIRRKIESIAKSIDKRISIHDLKITHQNENTILTFDCFCPDEVNITHQVLKLLIEEKVKKIDKNYICHITVDKSYVPIFK